MGMPLLAQRFRLSPCVTAQQQDRLPGRTKANRIRCYGGAPSRVRNVGGRPPGGPVGPPFRKQVAMLVTEAIASLLSAVTV